MDDRTMLELAEHRSNAKASWGRQLKDQRTIGDQAAEIARLKGVIVKFEQAIDNEMVASHLGVFNPGDDPKVALNKLQCYAEDLGAFFSQYQLKQQAAEIARLKAQLKSMERVELEEPNWSNNNEV